MDLDQLQQSNNISEKELRWGISDFQFFDESYGNIKLSISGKAIYQVNSNNIEESFVREYIINIVKSIIEDYISENDCKSYMNLLTCLEDVIRQKIANYNNNNNVIINDINNIMINMV